MRESAVLLWFSRWRFSSVLVVKANRVPRGNKALLVPRARRAIRGRPVLPE